MCRLYEFPSESLGAGVSSCRRQNRPIASDIKQKKQHDRENEQAKHIWEKKIDFPTEKRLHRVEARVLTGVNVLLLTGTRVLKPHLCDPFAQSRHRCNALQVLSIRVTVDLEVGLQHLQLLFGECGSDAFRFALVVAVRVTAICHVRMERVKRFALSLTKCGIR